MRAEALPFASLSLPSQGRWLGAAETERSQQICDNLSVCFADSSPERGAFEVRAPKSLPLSRGGAEQSEAERL